MQYEIDISYVPFESPPRDNTAYCSATMDPFIVLKTRQLQQQLSEKAAEQQISKINHLLASYDISEKVLDAESISNDLSAEVLKQVVKELLRLVKESPSDSKIATDDVASSIPRAGAGKEAPIVKQLEEERDTFKRRVKELEADVEALESANIVPTRKQGTSATEETENLRQQLENERHRRRELEEQHTSHFVNPERLTVGRGPHVAIGGNDNLERAISFVAQAMRTLEITDKEAPNDAANLPRNLSRVEETLASKCSSLNSISAELEQLRNDHEELLVLLASQDFEQEELRQELAKWGGSTALQNAQERAQQALRRFTNDGDNIVDNEYLSKTLEFMDNERGVSYEKAADTSMNYSFGYDSHPVTAIQDPNNEHGQGFERWDDNMGESGGTKERVVTENGSIGEERRRSVENDAVDIKPSDEQQASINKNGHPNCEHGSLVESFGLQEQQTTSQDNSSEQYSRMSEQDHPFREHVDTSQEGLNQFQDNPSKHTMMNDESSYTAPEQTEEYVQFSSHDGTELKEPQEEHSGNLEDDEETHYSAREQGALDYFRSQHRQQTDDVSARGYQQNHPTNVQDDDDEFEEVPLSPDGSETHRSGQAGFASSIWSGLWNLGKTVIDDAVEDPYYENNNEDTEEGYGEEDFLYENREMPYDKPGKHWFSNAELAAQRQHEYDCSNVDSNVKDTEENSEPSSSQFFASGAGDSTSLFDTDTGESPTVRSAAKWFG
eukprot:gb/GECG01003940.1/.p1 GENE.gb/GECG01003940.1/~~gb/GECG01003940.1/.p1  ORF type:complete len:727 (+),score=141.08 gb/GECG01003940.1/:1-2181(+)